MQQSYDPPVIPACHKNELIRDYSYGICLSKPEVKWIQPRLVTWILRKLNFPSRHPIINTTKCNITGIFGFYFIFVIEYKQRRLWVALVSKYTHKIYFCDFTSSGSMSLNSMPLPVQEMAPVLVGSSSRVTRNCQSWREPRRVGPGKNKTLKHETGIGPGKISCQTLKHETGIGPGKTGGPGWPPGPPGPQLVAWHDMHLRLH